MSSVAYLNILCKVGDRIEVVDAQIHSESAQCLTIDGRGYFWAGVMESGLSSDYAAAIADLVRTIYQWEHLAWARKFIARDGNSALSKSQLRDVRGEVSVLHKRADDNRLASDVLAATRPLVLALDSLTRTLRDMDPRKTPKRRPTLKGGKHGAGPKGVPLQSQR